MSPIRPVRPRIMAAALVAGVLLVSAVWASRMPSATSAVAAGARAPVRPAAPAQPAPTEMYLIVSHIDVPDVTGIAAQGRQLLVVGKGLGLRVYQLEDPYRPMEVGQLAVADAVRVVGDGGVALLAHGPSGSVSVVDLADPAAPRLRGTLPGAHPQDAMAAQDGVGAMADLRDLVAFDYADLDEPRSAGRVEMDYFGPLDISLQDGLAYVAQSYDGLTIVDLSDPNAPTIRGRLSAGAGLHGIGQSVTVDGSLAYLGERIPGSQFIPTHVPPTPGPSPTGPTPTPSPMATAPPDGGRLSVVDVSDADAPIVVGRTEADRTGPWCLVRANGARVWALAGYNRCSTVRAVDVTDPTRPHPVDIAVEPPLPWRAWPVDLAAVDDLLLLGGEGGVYVLRRAHDGWQTPTPTSTGSVTPTTAANTPTATATFVPVDPSSVYLPQLGKRLVQR